MKVLKTTDEYQEKKAAFEASKIAKVAQREFEVKPYSEKNKYRYWASIGTTYLLNVLSMVAFFVLPYFFLLSLTNNEVVSTLLSLLVLLAIEFYKRDLYRDLWKTQIQFGTTSKSTICFCLLVSVLSIGGSYFGGVKLVEESSSKYQFEVADTLSNVIALEIQAKTLRGDKESLESQKDSKGQTYYKVLPAIANLSTQIASIDNEVLSIKKEVRQKNSDAEISHNTTVMMEAEYFGLFSLLCELLFVLLSRYKPSYLYNSLAEFQDNKQQDNTNVIDKSVNVAPTTSTNVIDNKTGHNESVVIDPRLKKVNDEIKKIKRKITTNNNRLKKGKVKRETYDKNMALWTGQINKLKIERVGIEKSSQFKMKAV